MAGEATQEAIDAPAVGDAPSRLERQKTVWEEAVDANSGETYFYHPRTLEAAWYTELLFSVYR